MKKLIMVVLIGMMLIGCSKSNINIIKNGYLEVDSSTTIGKAFDNYNHFTQTKWSEFETPNGKQIVQFDALCEIDPNRNPEEPFFQKVSIQFIIFPDKHFKLKALRKTYVMSLPGSVPIDVDVTNVTDITTAISTIYKN